MTHYILCIFCSIAYTLYIYIYIYIMYTSYTLYIYIIIHVYIVKYVMCNVYDVFYIVYMYSPKHWPSKQGALI